MEVLPALLLSPQSSNLKYVITLLLSKYSWTDIWELMLSVYKRLTQPKNTLVITGFLGSHSIQWRAISFQAVQTYPSIKIMYTPWGNSVLTDTPVTIGKIDSHPVTLIAAYSYSNGNDRLHYELMSNATPKRMKIYVNELCDAYSKAIHEADGVSLYEYRISWNNRRVNNCKTMDKLFINKTKKQELIAKLDHFVKREDVYAEKCIPWKMGFLFIGEPGCGKTSGSYAIASYLNYDIYKIHLSEVTSSKELRDMFGKIPPKNVVVIDDIENQSITTTKQVISRDSYTALCDLIKSNVSLLSNIYMNVHDESFVWSASNASEQEIRDKLESIIGESPNVQSMYEYLHEQTGEDIKRSHHNILLTAYAICRGFGEKIYGVVEEIFQMINFDCPERLDELLGELLIKLAACFKTTTITPTQPNFNMADIYDILDGYTYLHGCIIIFTSNNPEKLPKALVRPGRIDFKIQFERANAAMCIDVLNSLVGSHKWAIPATFSMKHSELLNSIVMPNFDNPDTIQRIITDMFSDK